MEFEGLGMGRPYEIVGIEPTLNVGGTVYERDIYLRGHIPFNGAEQIQGKQGAETKVHQRKRGEDWVITTNR